jgi:hypothetical protein
MTAFPDDEVQSKVCGLGRAALLAKPFGSEELLTLVRQSLAEGR